MQKELRGPGESSEPFQNELKNLDNKPIDYFVALAKATAGLHPQYGPFLSELVSLTPGQRLDRTIRYLRTLDARVSHLEAGFVQLKLQIEAFQVLYEESVVVASKATSDERRNYIASIVAGDIESPDVSIVDYENKRRILSILDQINDIEVLWLMFFSRAMDGRGEEFYQQHKRILGVESEPGASEPTPVFEAIYLVGPHDARRDLAEMHHHYREHLYSLGLLEKNTAVGKTDRVLLLPVFSEDGKMAITGYDATHFGKLFLRGITDGQFDSSEADLPETNPSL